MGDKRRADIFKKSSEAPPFGSFTEQLVERTQSRRRLSELLARPPHVGVTLMEEGARDALQMLLALTGEEAVAETVVEARRQEARVQEVVESLEFYERLVAGEATAGECAAITKLDLSGSEIRDLSRLAGLSGLQTLDVRNTQVSDLTPLAELGKLEALYLTSTRVSDLTPLVGLSALESLYLGGTQVSDLTPLAGLSALQYLDLDGTQVSDLTPLAGLSGLRRLLIRRTKVTDVSPLEHLTKKGLEIVGP